jgi:hypothetical protein
MLFDHGFDFFDRLLKPFGISVVKSLDTLIDAIAAANTSLSVAINTHWRALLTAIDHTVRT